MKREQANDRLLQALLEMKNEIQTRIRPIEELSRPALKALRNRLTLSDSLTARQKDIRLSFPPSGRIQLELTTLNEKLSRLSEAPLSIPNSIPIEDFEGTIRHRIEYLKMRGLY